MKRIEDIKNLKDMIIYISKQPNKFELIDKYNDFSLRYKDKKKAVDSMKEYLINVKK